MPIKVVLDTNVYSSDKFRLGQGFKTLGSLCKNKHVEVMLPYIVKREFETQLEANATEIVTGFEKFGKRLAGGPIPDDLRGELDGLLAKLKAQKQEVLGSHNAHFSAWLKEYAVTELTLDGEHAVAAMENYFSAGPPFQSAKRREDIPDAMIYQAVVSSAEGGPIVFVCNDQKLASAMVGIGNITHYNDLNEFIASDDVQAIISEQEAAERATNLLQRLEKLASTSPNPLAEFVSERGGEGLASTSFSSPSIPGDDREAYIYMFGSLDDIEFDWSRAAYHGNLVYVVPFSGEGEFNITYYVPKWDVEDIERRGGSYSDHNDYVVEAHEAAVLFVRGTLRIKISDGFEPGDELVNAIDEIAIDSLEDPILAEDRD
ncbi:hypothetical protein DSC_11795 [Pseudoxanthomonas spadix BD-a59]|uniref:DUF4935 domain-containing protein n=1 Tax=Pseudoxanthomonas spadix (strain BD-a59) TaxID=1045855 RepID=G7UQK0_PSEUP|nr:PIN domain-containing protein [Pseudoxanthomonas spadix]AER57003.1 hypothetical protein DSC_11795 [Pseudoxanthomonas spadix BD-a59]